MAENLPPADNEAVRTWDEPSLLARIERRAAQLGKPVSALLTAAGFSEDLVRKSPRSGRRLDSLEKIASALHWSLGELLGIIDPERPQTTIDPDKLRVALQLANNVVGTNPLPAGTEREAVIAQIAVEAYDAVSALERERPQALESEEGLAVLEALLRRNLPK